MVTPINPVSTICIAHGEHFGRSACIQLLSERGIQCVQVRSVDELVRLKPALLLLDGPLIRTLPEGWRARLDSGALIGCEEHADFDADFYVARDFATKPTLRNILMAIEHWSDRQMRHDMAQLPATTEDQKKLVQLAEIGIALSAEKHLATLLNRILSEGRKLACCDAASLFLVDRSKEEGPELVFKLTQNASIDFTMREARFPMDERSIVGWVAINGRRLRIDDAYQIPDSAPYGFNRSFDEEVGYRTISLLAIPMKNRRNEVIGVLQFINRTREPGVEISTPEAAMAHVIPFDDSVEVLLRSLASQSAIAIENKVLMDSIRRLFDGFVQASVVAIEQRDPTTSGHSFRVADLCLRLAEVLPHSTHPTFREIEFANKDLTALRYAALLHDFGKVGVRESVLTKPKKLTQHQFDVLAYRVRLNQEAVRRQAAEQVIELMKQGAGTQDIQAVYERADEACEQLALFWQRIQEANEPSILPEGYFEHLNEISQYPALDCHGNTSSLLTPQQLSALSIPKGSLTEEERLEIQSHVIHTEHFLKLIPWTPDLSVIPTIAAAHHEKLDGSGYPRGLGSEEIPVGARIMAVCDIYDALTAADRPYKTAVPDEVAFRILNAEAERGLLERELVRLFIDAKVYEVIKGKEYVRSEAMTSVYHHHVCDFDLME